MMLGSMSSAFVLDYGLGNLYSLSCALLKSGFKKVEFISNPESFKKVDNLFLPGVGAFGKAMNLLKEKHLDEAIKTHVKSGKPLLGICLGMQLLSNESYEFGKRVGLGIISGEVKKIEYHNPHISSINRPTIGWFNTKVSNTSHFMSDKINNKRFYYIHSYQFISDDKFDMMGDYDLYRNKILAFFFKDNIGAVQFHPEKSGKSGLNFLIGYRESIKKN